MMNPEPISMGGLASLASATFFPEGGFTRGCTLVIRTTASRTLATTSAIGSGGGAAQAGAKGKAKAATTRKTAKMQVRFRARVKQAKTVCIVALSGSGRYAYRLSGVV